MPNAVYCRNSNPPVDLVAHRRIRLRRFGLRGAVASVVADLAFGEARDAVLVVVTIASPEVR